MLSYTYARGLLIELVSSGFIQAIWNSHGVRRLGAHWQRQRFRAPIKYYVSPEEVFSYFRKWAPTRRPRSFNLNLIHFNRSQAHHSKPRPVTDNVRSELKSGVKITRLHYAHLGTCIPLNAACALPDDEGVNIPPTVILDGRTLRLPLGAGSVRLCRTSYGLLHVRPFFPCFRISPMLWAFTCAVTALLEHHNVFG